MPNRLYTAWMLSNLIRAVDLPVVQNQAMRPEEEYGQAIRRQPGGKETAFGCFSEESATKYT
jgi:hypothetical protein